MDGGNFYIEFYVNDAERLGALQVFFDKLKSDKGNENREPDSDEVYVSYFELLDEDAKKWFDSPENEDGWDFESMLSCLFIGEYSFTEIVRKSEKEAVLYYDPWAGPFGGTESIKVLIEAFGHIIMYDSWNDGMP